MTKAAQRVRDAAVGRRADQRPGLHRPVRPRRRARDRPHPAGARGRPGRRRAGHRRSPGQDGRRPRRRPRDRRAAGDRQAGAGRAGDEPAHVAAPGDAAQRRAARKPTASHFVGPNAGEMAERGEAGPGRMAEAPEIVAAIESCCSAPPRTAATEPLAGRHVLSPAARRTSRSTRCATSPTAPPASRATPSPRRRRALGARVTLVSGPVTLARSGRRQRRPRRDGARDAGGGRGGAARRRRASSPPPSPTGASPSRAPRRSRRRRRQGRPRSSSPRTPTS